MKTLYRIVIQNALDREFPPQYDHFGSVASARAYALILVQRHEGTNTFADIVNENGDIVAIVKGN